MLRFYIKETEEYERLVGFMKPFGLEFDNDEKLGTELIKCWKVIQEPDYLVGAVMLGRRSGEYYINGIAVDPPMRRTGVGRIMMKKAISEVKKLGGERIYLVAKVHEFFRSLGFTEIGFDEAPEGISGCSQCDHFGKDCDPRMMVLELE